MSSLLRHQSDHRLLPSLLTSPSRRRIDFVNSANQDFLNIQLRSHSAITERLEQVLGLQQESVLNYGSDNHFLVTEPVTDLNDLTGNLGSLTISDRVGQSRPATAPIFRSISDQPLYNSDANRTMAGARRARDRNNSRRMMIRMGRNERRLRNESRELIEHLTNENAIPGVDAIRRERLDQRLKITTIPSMSDLHYLQTYDMRNNFYLNLVTWSRVKNRIAVAIKEKVYWWDGQRHVAPINLNGNLNSISVISCSSSDVLAVGFQDGTQGSLCLLFPDRRRLKFSHNCAFQCLAWFPDKPYLIAGDMLGSVIIFEYSELSIRVKSKWKGFEQQVCGM